MEILLDKRAVRHIRLSAAAAVEDGDLETLHEDIMDAFSDDQVEEIERRIDGGDFHEFVNEAVEEWGGDDVDEVLELVASRLGEVGIDLKLHGADAEEEEDEDEDEEDDDEEEEDADDEDFEADEEFGDPLEEDIDED